MTKEKTTEVPEKGLVLYTDGGARPNPGFAGWGIHGYTYDVTPLEKPSRKVAAFTDKGYNDTDGKTVKDGTGKSDETYTFHKPLGFIDAWGPCPPSSSNNAAELQAAVQAFKLINELSPTKATILYDSQYVFGNLLKSVPKWETNGWITSSGKEVTNKETWQELAQAYRSATANIEVTFKWVKGHSDDLGNDYADIAATRGLILARKELENEVCMMSVVPNYRSAKSDYNRLFAHPRYYFVSNAKEECYQHDGRHLYHLGSMGKDIDMHGKRVSDHSYAVLLLKEPEPVLDTVRKYQDALTDHDYNNVVMGHLDRIFQPAVYNDILTNGDRYMLRIDRRYRLRHAETGISPTDPVLTEERETAGLIFRATEHFGDLEALIKQFIAGEHGGFVTTDLTDVFYETTQQKKKEVTTLSSKIKQTERFILVDANYDSGKGEKSTKVKLTIGQDIPNRNALVALAADKPKVTLITERGSENCFRYHVVIEVGDDVSIWSSVFSNLKIVLE